MNKKQPSEMWLTFGQTAQNRIAVLAPKIRKICEANFSTQNSKGIWIVALQTCGRSGASLRHICEG